jgi:hypothetical protein
VIEHLFDAFIEEGDGADLDADHLFGDEFGWESICSAGCRREGCACGAVKKLSAIHDVCPF